ncbi:hypothetical protein DPMN_193956 [Dreissena polymorpha]|uniref:Uncharacterized protein n=1 Tax=Dreissena polymorpha TaxID=45954 RepID=A0A9D3Y5I6_DREPO|nr:hypothetical protein DPMN_193956 [Dreissena polymorpha]
MYVTKTILLSVTEEEALMDLEETTAAHPAEPLEKATATPLATAPSEAPVVTTPLVTAPLLTAPVATAPVATAPVVTAPVVTLSMTEEEALMDLEETTAAHPADPLETATATPLATAPSEAPVVTTPLVTAPLVTAPLVTAPVATAPVATAP